MSGGTVRRRLPQTRTGTIHKIEVGEVDYFITINRHPETRAVSEIFCKVADRTKSSHERSVQSEADIVCIALSLALQHGAPAARLLEDLRKADKGQPCEMTLSRILVRALEMEMPS